MKITVLGVGNELQADDGVGIFIGRLCEKTLPGTFREHEFQFIISQNPENYVQKVVRFLPDLVILIDSADFNGIPGEHRLIEEEEVEGFTYSTHNAPLTVFMKAVRSLSPVKPDVLLVGIQPKVIGFGEEMSREVKTSAKDVLPFITDLIEKKESRMEEEKSPLKSDWKE